MNDPSSLEAKKERARARARAWRKANPERAREAGRKWRAEHREYLREANASYYREHRDALVVRQREYNRAHKDDAAAYYAANSDRIRAYSSAYSRANPERAAAHSRNRRALIKGSLGTHTTADIAAQRTRQKGLCYWCGKRVGRSYHVDHVVPLSRGGSNDPSNLVIACSPCNLAKHAKLPHEFSDRLC